MKKFYKIIFGLLAMLILVNSALATTHIIMAKGTTFPTDEFDPEFTFAQVGDTIRWVWIEGEHTTESTFLPAGADSWAADLDSIDTAFTYVVTLIGNYEFDCHYAITFNTGHGMTGAVLVSAATSIKSDEPNIGLAAFPNPFVNQVIFRMKDADEIRVYNIVGQQVLSRSLQINQSEVRINTSQIPVGVYFFSALRDGIVVETKKLLKKS